MKIIYETITGSKAYGLDTPQSDTDSMGVFVAPTLDVAGLDWNQHKETRSDASPVGDDHSYHEVGKFLRLTLKGNPTLIELYFMQEHQITTLTEWGERLLALRSHVVSEETVRKSYHGYAYAQMREYQNRPNPKEKMARHCLRIARQAVEILTTGNASVRVADRQEYFDLTKMSKLDMIEKLEREVDKIRTCNSVIRETPDREAVAHFLRILRRAHL